MNENKEEIIIQLLQYLLRLDIQKSPKALRQYIRDRYDITDIGIERLIELMLDCHFLKIDSDRDRYEIQSEGIKLLMENKTQQKQLEIYAAQNRISQKTNEVYMLIFIVTAVYTLAAVVPILVPYIQTLSSKNAPVYLGLLIVLLGSLSNQYIIRTRIKKYPTEKNIYKKIYDKLGLNGGFAVSSLTETIGLTGLSLVLGSALLFFFPSLSGFEFWFFAGGGAFAVALINGIRFYQKT